MFSCTHIFMNIFFNIYFVFVFVCSSGLASISQTISAQFPHWASLQILGEELVSPDLLFTYMQPLDHWRKHFF